MNKTAIPPIDKTATLRALSAQDFLTFGVNQIAYIKPVKSKDAPGGTAWVIHAANGQPLSVTATMDEALASSWQNDLKPVRVH